MMYVMRKMLSMTWMDVTLEDPSFVSRFPEDERAAVVAIDVAVAAPTTETATGAGVGAIGATRQSASIAVLTATGRATAGSKGTQANVTIVERWDI